MAEGPYVPPVWMNVTVAFIRGPETWRVDLRVERQGGAKVQVLPMYSGSNGVPMPLAADVILWEHLRQLVEVAIAQVLEPF